MFVIDVAFQPTAWCEVFNDSFFFERWCLDCTFAESTAILCSKLLLCENGKIGVSTWGVIYNGCLGCSFCQIRRQLFLRTMAGNYKSILRGRAWEAPEILAHEGRRMQSKHDLMKLM